MRLHQLSRPVVLWITWDVNSMPARKQGEEARRRKRLCREELWGLGGGGLGGRECSLGSLPRGFHSEAKVGGHYKVLAFRVSEFSSGTTGSAGQHDNPRGPNTSGGNMAGSEGPGAAITYVKSTSARVT